MYAWKSNGGNSHSCNCIGPQRGQPLCPCMMRGVTVKDGRYIQVRDLGPVNEYFGKLDLDYGYGSR